MKKTVLLLAALLLGGATAQAQWVSQPVNFRSGATPTYIDAVSATVAWSASTDLAGGGGDRQVARTIDGGATWTVITIPTLVDGDAVTGVVGLSASTALVCVVTDAGGGQILRTTDGGTTWTVQTTPAQFAGLRSYPDAINFFNATDGVCIGDRADSGDNSLEIYTTTNAGATWTRVVDATLPPALPNEYGPYTILENQIPATVSGNTIWYPTSEGRVFKSADKGLTWTVSDTGLGSDIQSLAFRDANNGLAITYVDGPTPAHLLARSTNGGTTWQPVNYSGHPRPLALKPVPGTGNFLTVGVDLSSGGGLDDGGSAYSRDNGQTWIDLETTFDHVALDVASPTAAWTGLVDVNTGVSQGAGKLTSTVLAAAKDVALQRGLSVFPNPSADGQFTVKLAAGLPAGTQLTVLDALGRRVYARTAAAATPTLGLDLGQQPAGLYTLQVQTASGVALQKLVIK